MDVFFMYDVTYCKEESDDPKDAIIFFYPDSMPDEKQHVLCGQLVGIARFLQSCFSNAKIATLQTGKFAFKYCENYLLVVGGKTDLPNDILVKLVNTLHNIYCFYHMSFEAGTQVCSGNRLMFQHRMKNIWQWCLNQYCEDSSLFFDAVPLIEFPKEAYAVYLEASQVLESCEKLSGVSTGCILYRNRMVCSHMTPAMSFKLAGIGSCPHMNILPSELNMPPGVRLVKVYPNREEGGATTSARFAYIESENRDETNVGKEWNNSFSVPSSMKVRDDVKHKMHFLQLSNTVFKISKVFPLVPGYANIPTNLTIENKCMHSSCCLNSQNYIEEESQFDTLWKKNIFIHQEQFYDKMCDANRKSWQQSCSFSSSSHSLTSRQRRFHHIQSTIDHCLLHKGIYRTSESCHLCSVLCRSVNSPVNWSSVTHNTVSPTCQSTHQGSSDSISLSPRNDFCDRLCSNECTVSSLHVEHDLGLESIHPEPASIGNQHSSHDTLQNEGNKSSSEDAYLVLYVQGYGDIHLVLQVEDTFCNNLTSLNHLWNRGVSTLGDLEVALKSFPGPIEKNSLSYDLAYHKWLHTMKSSSQLVKSWKPFKADSTKEDIGGDTTAQASLGTIAEMHTELKNNPKLLDITVATAENVIQVHHTPVEEIYTIEHRAKQKIPSSFMRRIKFGKKLMHGPIRH